MTNLSISIYAWIQSVLTASKEERGQDLVEYALWCGCIALFMIAIGALTLYTGAAQDMATGLGNCIDFDTTTGCTPF